MVVKRAVTKRAIGTTGILVNPIGLGSMPLALQGRPSEKEAIHVIHAALDNGVDFIDTADVYCVDHRDIGYAERLISKALQSWAGKAKVIVATKGGLERPNGAWTVNGNPKHLKAACEASLKSLNVDTIDLYQWHAVDPAIPLEDSVDALISLKNEGKIKHLGLSNVDVQTIKKVQTMTNIVSIQNRCHPFYVQAFYDGVINYCEKEKLAFIAYSPMGGSGQKELTGNHPVLLAIAEEKGADPYQIALAWLLAKSPNMITIPGASHISSILSSLKSYEVAFNLKDLLTLDKAFLS